MGVFDLADFIYRVPHYFGAADHCVPHTKTDLLVKRHVLVKFSI